MELNLENYKGLLVVGDVHSVFSDFATSYSYARKNNLYYLQLGDILDYGPKPLETMLLAKEILEWEPKIDIKDGLGKTISWFRKIL